MRNIIIIVVMLIPFFLAGQTVKKNKGYIKKNGTYVAPHLKTESDDNFDNNYSTKGNSNPFTGKKGTKTKKKTF